MKTSKIRMAQVTDPKMILMRGLMYTAAKYAIDSGVGDEYLEFLEQEIRGYSPRSKRTSIVIEHAIADTKRLLGKKAS